MTTSSVQAPFTRSTNISAGRWYFTGLALAMIGVSVAGFAPSLLHPSSRPAPLSLLAAAHGFVFLAWQILFLVQSGFIAARRIAWHRRMGASAVVVLAVMLPLGFMTTVSMGRRGFDLSGDLTIQPHPSAGFVDAIAGMLFPLTDLSMFATLAIAALVCRRRREIHKRLMLFANIMLMPAPLQHFIGHHPALASIPAPFIMVPIALFLFSAVVRDYLVDRRIHPLTLTLAILLLASGPLRAIVVGPSAAWRHFAAWLIG